MKVLVLHAYSATNAGDGLLVEETIGLLREAFVACDITVAALHPGTFDLPSVTVIDAAPSWKGFSRDFRRTLKSLSSFDLVVGVGGGYIRAGHPVEALKMAVTHGYQLMKASRTSVPVVYLPQSIGPLRFGVLPWAQYFLRRINRVYLRDDRSITELKLDNAVRIQDLATMTGEYVDRADHSVNPKPVLSVRAVRGNISNPVKDLAVAIGSFDGYVQSRGAGNDDTAAMSSLGPETTLSREQLLSSRGQRRVVIAVRLHAALMAINAGHWVVHLAYERKGFGAFDDLGLPDYVFNVNSFDVDEVRSLVEGLLHDPDRRLEYDKRLKASRSGATAARSRLIGEIQQLAKA
ncbi:polysaccharide pyruvyl transferase family protein [Paenarthrobacter sp. YIM B13468]|uniref:polysaccharide pyruvyl transferase family protein n=1 Tax=Paenarthrobacter sp. YIM B13468 TaxID=3366295 RepID=UPI0036715307